MNPIFARNLVVTIGAALSGIVGFAVFSPKSGQAPIHSPTPTITANPLIGEWEVVESFLSQKQVPRDLLPKLRIRFTERLMIFSPGIAQKANKTFTEVSDAIRDNRPYKPVELVFVVDEIGWTWAYQIDPTKVPQEIDLLQTQDGKEERVKGIYKIDGDRAILVLGENYRPSDFSKPSEKRGGLFKIRRKGP